MKIGITAIGIGKAARPGTIRTVAENAERLAQFCLRECELLLIHGLDTPVQHHLRHPRRLGAERGNPVRQLRAIFDAPEKIAAARKRLLGYGFIPYFADRALEHMRIGDLPDRRREE